MRLVAIFLAALCAVPAFAGGGSDTELLDLLAALLKEGQSRGRIEGEVAAFIVAEDGDRLRCMLWPAKAISRGEQFRGVVPEGTVAIAHTHPQYAERPSTHDLDEARRVGLPIYVVTPSHVFKADPKTRTSIRVAGPAIWWRDLPAEKGTCERNWVTSR